MGWNKIADYLIGMSLKGLKLFKRSKGKVDRIKIQN